MKTLLVLLPMLLLTLLTCTPEQQAQIIEGLIQDIDSAEGRVTITKKDGTVQEFQFDVTTPVEGPDGEAVSQPLEPGDDVQFEVNPQTNKVKRVKVPHAEVEGTIQGLDPENRTVTILSERGREVTLHIPEGTRIKLEEDFPGGFADLRIGAEIEAKFNPDTLVASKIKVEEQEAEVKGVVQAVNTDSNTLTIVTQSGRELELRVESQTRVDMDDFKGATLADLKVGDEVEAKFNPETRVAYKIEVED